MSRNPVSGLDAAGLLLAASDTQQKPSPAISVPAPEPDRDLLSHKQYPPEIASVLAITQPSLITRQWVIKELLRPPVRPSAAQTKQFPIPTALPAHTCCLPLPRASFACAQSPVALHHHSPAQIHSPSCLVTHNEGIQVQEQELQHVMEGLGQTGIGCAPKCTDNLSQIFRVYQIMGHAYNCASAWAPATLETSP